MTREEIATLSEILDFEVIFLEGYDDCIAGLMERFNMPPLVCYDKDKIINKLMKEGMSPAEADEWFDFNIIGGWLGDATPCFITNENI